MSVINVYVKRNAKGYVIVCLYVDDMIIIANNYNIKAKKNMLCKNLYMKGLDVIDMILGIKIYQDIG